MDKSGQFCKGWYRKIAQTQEGTPVPHCVLEVIVKHWDRAVKISGHESSWWHVSLSATTLTHFKTQSLSLFNFKKVQNKIKMHFTTP